MHYIIISAQYIDASALCIKELVSTFSHKMGENIEYIFSGLVVRKNQLLDSEPSTPSLTSGYCSSRDLYNLLVASLNYTSKACKTLDRRATDDGNIPDFQGMAFLKNWTIL